MSSLSSKFYSGTFDFGAIRFEVESSVGKNGFQVVSPIVAQPSDAAAFTVAQNVNVTVNKLWNRFSCPSVFSIDGLLKLFLRTVNKYLKDIKKRCQIRLLLKFGK